MLPGLHSNPAPQGDAPTLLMKMRVLVVEDDDHLREVLLTAATLEGYLATAVASAEEGLQLLEKDDFEILVTDVNLPGMSGLDFLQEVVNRDNQIVAVVMTAFGTIDVAVEAM